MSMPAADVTLYAVWEKKVQAATPVIAVSPESADGKYANNKEVTVTITTATEGADIYYSIDGGENTVKYTEPFKLTVEDSANGKTIEISAYAQKSDMLNSNNASKTIEFKAKEYNITVKQNPHGTITIGECNNGTISTKNDYAHYGDEVKQ